MELQCKHISASEAGDEIFQVLFEVHPEQEDSPYLLISRSFFEEDEVEPSSVYVETNDGRLTGHYKKIKAQLERHSFTIRLPPPAADTIKVDFTTSEMNFNKVKRMLQIIFQEDID